MGIDDLKQNEMMAHLVSSLESGQDIGHYGRLVFVMVSRFFLDDEEMVKMLTHDPDCDRAKASGLIQQVKARNYNPPKPERVLEWMNQQEFPICPTPEEPQSCNVYRDFQFPKELYDKISGYYDQHSAVEVSA